MVKKKHHSESSKSKVQNQGNLKSLKYGLKKTAILASENGHATLPCES